MTRDFSITLDLHSPGADFRVLADCASLVGEASGSISASSLQELHAVQMQLERQGMRATRKQAVEAGAALFEALLTGETRTLFREACRSAWKRGDSLRMMLKMDAAGLPQLAHGLSWELMYDPDRERFLAIDPDVFLVRYLRQGRPVSTFPAGSVLRGLLTSACPAHKDCPPLPQLALEMDELGECLVRPSMRQRTRGRFHRDIAFDALQEDLVSAERESEQPFHFWHHCGHGRFDGQNGYQLAFEPGRPDTPGAGPWIGIAALKTTLRQCHNLRLVFLSVCLGASPEGLGPLLAGLGVPAVIGHAAAVGDGTARQFAREFWRAFATLPVDAAVQRARQLLAGAAHPFAFAHAVLFLRALDPFSPVAVAQ